MAGAERLKRTAIFVLIEGGFQRKRGEDTKWNLKHVGYLFSLVKARRKLLT
jgi:hypothetical protein